jgi:hypothetical protein
MKTARIAKILAAATLASLSLMAGTSRADNWGFHAYGGFPPPGQGMRGDAGPGPLPPAAFCPPRAGYSSVDARQERQLERIHDGMRSGQLTRHEARDLLHDQRRIEHLERRYLADGRLSGNEWRDLNRRLDGTSREIRAERHDFERYGQGGGGHRHHGRD